MGCSLSDQVPRLSGASGISSQLQTAQQQQQRSSQVGTSTKTLVSKIISSYIVLHLEPINVGHCSYVRLIVAQVSSSSSTLSLLFGKRSFSSGLVISGLSAAEGGNTTDTQSSSSVNIAVGPSHRSSSRATQVGSKQNSSFISCWDSILCEATTLSLESHLLSPAPQWTSELYENIDATYSDAAATVKEAVKESGDQPCSQSLEKTQDQDSGSPAAETPEHRTTSDT